jgi:hypothetical protein
MTEQKNPSPPSASMILGTTMCADNKTWICMACGKLSRTKYGFDFLDRNCADHGWDVSCMMHAELITKEELKDIRAVPI